MQRHLTASEKMDQLIHQPPRPWQLLIQALINAAKDALLAVDCRGDLFLVNAMAQERFGEIKGMPLKTAIPQLAEMVNQTLADGTCLEKQTVQMGTSTYWANTTSISAEDDTIGVICVLQEHTDVGELAGQMRFFKDVNRELNAIIDSSSDGLFVCDAEANVIRVNPASERIHDVKAADLIGKNMVDLIEQGFIDRSAALQVCQNKTGVSLLQEKNQRKLISTGMPVFDEAGSLIRVVVSERDITEIDRLQRELEEQASMKDQLQHQLIELQQAELITNKIIARSPAMLRTLERAFKVCSVNSSVLITGESGVGKGLIANLIHTNSNRASEPLIRINCGAIPETLVESELFGYEAGAFTGAKTGGKPGSLELADGGSLFLDEIAELPPSAQVKLLRFLENRRLTRLGGSTVRTIDARILAATHRNLREMVANGTFRNDLYYRLNVIPLAVPPLRDRTACIPPLLRHFVDQFATSAGVTKRFSHAALDVLLAYAYPGNVRELMNICERAVVMSEGDVIDLPDLPRDVTGPIAEVSMDTEKWSTGMTLEKILQTVERQVLLSALKKYKNQTDLAAALGVSQPTIARRLKKYQIP